MVPRSTGDVATTSWSPCWVSLFIVGAATALIVAVNRDKTVKKKVNPQEQRIANNLPPLLIPAPPPPLPSPAAASAPASTKAGADQVPAILAPHGGSTAIPVLGSHKPAMGSNGKPVLDWMDRKMGGTLLVAVVRPGFTGTVPLDALSSRTIMRRHSPENCCQVRNELVASAGVHFDQRRHSKPVALSAISIIKGHSAGLHWRTALDSTLPGLTTCRLTRDVYSDNGQVLLLDRGSQLVGSTRVASNRVRSDCSCCGPCAKTPKGGGVAQLTWHGCARALGSGRWKTILWSGLAQRS